MATIFQQLALALAPGYLSRGPHGSAFLQATGIVLDFYTERLLQGIRAHQPLLCDSSALPEIASDWGIHLYDLEPIASKRHRLTQWKPLKKHKGSHLGEMMNVQPFFLAASALPTIRIVHQAGDGSSVTWHTLNPLGGLYTGAPGQYVVTRASPSNWNFDGQTSKWSRWWAIVYLPVGYLGGFHYDGATAWDSGAIWDGISAADLADIYNGFREFKAAHSFFAGLILVLLQPTDTIPSGTGHPFDPASTAQTIGSYTTLPTGNWGSPVWTSGASAGLPTRPPWAIFYNIDGG